MKWVYSGLVAIVLALLVLSSAGNALAQEIDFSRATFTFVPGAIKVNNIIVEGQLTRYWAEFALDPTGQLSFNGNFGVYSADETQRIETCQVCHHPGAEFGVDTVHLPALLNPELFNGINIEITSTSGGTGPNGTFQAGDRPVVTYTVRDDSGADIPLSSLAGMSIAMSGPTSNYQQVIQSAPGVHEERNVHRNSTTNPDGSHTYTFQNAISATYLPPHNDSPRFGPDDGETTGQPLEPGTYSIGLWGYNARTIEGETVRDAGSAVVDVLVGGATTLEPRRVVEVERCNRCHGDLALHGATRKDTRLCVMCHTAGAEDRISVDPAKATPDVTIEFKVMIHKIHKGADLHRLPYQIIGFGESVHDFSHVEFPYMPDGVRNCTVCHVGDHWRTNPQRKVCGACHDDVNFATGENHPGGPQANDQVCFACHPPEVGGVISVTQAHLPPLLNPELFNGVNIAITSTSGGTGPNGTFQAGDRPTITYTVRDNPGADIPLSSLAGLSIVMSGPTSNYQHVIQSAPSVPQENNVHQNSTTNPDGSHTYTFQNPISATYLPPHNDSTRFGPDDGETAGLPIEPGTYSIGLWGFTAQTVEDRTVRDADSAVADVLVGGATVLEPRRVVEVARCNECHNDLALHGATRKDTKLCVLCHTRGAEDRISTDPAKATPDRTIVFRSMIHKIHKGAELHERPFQIIGFGESVHDFSEVEFPLMPGGVRQCSKCHGESNAWQQPSQQVCTACHDSDRVRAHTDIMIIYP